MTSYDVVLVLHVLLLVYWLGADLGVFYASRFLLKPALSAEARLTAARIMHGCDTGPRVAMPLMLPVGLTLADRLGLSPVGGAALAAAWVLGVGWALLALALHLRAASVPRLLRYVDTAIRVGVATAMVGWGAWSLATDRGLLTDWLPLKAIAYGAAVACGLGIRAGLPRFDAAFGELLASGSTPEVEARLRSGLRRVEPFVYGIWVSVAAAAVMGLLKRP